MGDDSPVSLSLGGRQKARGEERGRWIDRWGWLAPNALLLGLIFPLVCQGAVGVLTVADADFVPVSNLWLLRIFKCNIFYVKCTLEAFTH